MFTLFTQKDIDLFNKGTHHKLYERLGSHLVTVNRVPGCYFAVWAPNAEQVTVIGDFNQWNKTASFLQPLEQTGIWHGFIPGISNDSLYKYHIRSKIQGHTADKADPFAYYHQIPPDTASRVWNLDYSWSDHEWLKTRHQKNSLNVPISIYELHLGSWMRAQEQNNRFLTYKELAPKLTEYVKQMRFTHVEFLPIMEHPFYGSWGYQTTGYFAPTSRYGTPQDFMALIDILHQNQIGVILDWVPSHFPSDQHGLGFFDGTHLYEHADPRQGFHPDWNSLIFNYGHPQVCDFLISSALFWMEKYHADALRIDAVASMLYLDYARKEGEWIPNKFGRNENLEAVTFLQNLNEQIYKHFPDTQTIAEESTAWPKVSRPRQMGGLGFGMKWDMGWMHDTLQYLRRDTAQRKHHQDELTFRSVYTFNENFVLSLSHDEVVYGKKSLLMNMPGDEWKKFSNLRLLYGYMFCQPGKKLLFMGDEFAQLNEWYHETGLDWNLLRQDLHKKMQLWVKDLNSFYGKEPALHEQDCDPAGFEWIDCSDTQQSILSFMRKGKSPDDLLLAVFNFVPTPRYHYQIGVPQAGFWKEILNSDATVYGGSGVGNLGGAQSYPQPFHNRPHSIKVALPPLGMTLFVRGRS